LMYREHLPVLACPDCQSQLLAVGSEDWIEQGLLSCINGHEYEVRGGAPRLLASADTQSAQTLDSFNWQYPNEEILEYDLERVRQRLKPTFGLDASSVSDKRVCVIGCGNGPEVRVMLDLGATFVAGIDLTNSIDVAAHLVSGDRRALIAQADAQSPPLVPGTFDLIYSDGVLAHVADPHRALAAMLDLLRPGGRAAVRTIFAGGSTRKWAHTLPRLAIRTITSRLSSPMLWRVAGGFARVAELPLIGRMAERLFVYTNPDRRDRWATQLENFRRYGKHTFRHRLRADEALGVIRAHVPGSAVTMQRGVIEVRIPE
jgi:SAM-dependent methyltransferase